MSETGDEQLLPPENYTKVILIAIGAVAVLSAITIGAYQYAKKRSGVVVLPGGTTYLGPSDTPVQPPPETEPAKPVIDENTKWIEHKGIDHPFTFLYPESIELVTFPKDITESAGFGWGNIQPQSNLLFRIIDINASEPAMVKYINQPKIEYVKHWWEQYTGGLKGVESVTPFTNSRGMKGYRAKYLNHSDQTPNDDIFFEVPGRRDLMVRFGNGPLEKTVFDKIIDSFSWGKTAQPTTISSPIPSP